MSDAIIQMLAIQLQLFNGPRPVTIQRVFASVTMTTEAGTYVCIASPENPDGKHTIAWGVNKTLTVKGESNAIISACSILCALDK